MTEPTDRIRLAVDAVQQGWNIAQHDTMTVFALADNVLIVSWSDVGEATNAELSQQGQLRAYAKSPYCTDVATWVEMVLVDIPASKGAVA